MTRKFSSKSAQLIICVMCLILFPAVALAADITLKLGHIAPIASTHDVSAKKFAERVVVNTNGKVEVKVFGNSQFGGAVEHWSQLTAGAIDLFDHELTGSEMVEPKPKNFQILLSPYLFVSYKHLRNFLKSDLFKSMMAKVEKAANIKFLGYVGDRAPRGFTTTKTKITTPADIKSLKLRVPPSPAWVDAYKSWGANPTPVPAKELYSALKSGMVDGMDIDIVSTYSAKFYEIQKYFVAIDWLYSGVCIWMNADKWASLPNEMQAAILKAVKETENYVNGFTAQEITDAKKALTEASVEIIYPDLKPWMEATKATVLSNEGKVWEKGLYAKIKALE